MEWCPLLTCSVHFDAETDGKSLALSTGAYRGLVSRVKTRLRPLFVPSTCRGYLFPPIISCRVVVASSYASNCFINPNPANSGT